MVFTLLSGSDYVCYDINYEKLDTIYSREKSYYNRLFFEGEVESIDDQSECNEKYIFQFDITVST